MTIQISLMLPLILVLCSLATLMALVKIYKVTKRGKRSPLTQDLLRSPGESLRRQIEEYSENITYYTTVIIFLPLLFYVFLEKMLVSQATGLLFSLALLGVTGVFLYKLWNKLKLRNNLRLALDCEMAVGQELNQLMLQGCLVYHDFPAEKFNIDHVVISPKGVFAIETKGRAKPDKKGGTAEATVVYDGAGLKFPGWFEKEPIEQAKRQAKWISAWLSSAVGDPVTVRPVLVLPGWFIQLDKRADIFIFNGKNPDMLLKWVNGDRLSESMFERIRHQIDQRCRDVEPLAYGQEKKN